MAIAISSPSQHVTLPLDGGKLGYFGHGKMDADFTSAAFALKNVGDVSEPVKSAFGWHIIRLDGRRAAGDLPFERARKQIMADLKARYIRDALTARLDAIRILHELVQQKIVALKG